MQGMLSNPLLGRRFVAVFAVAAALFGGAPLATAHGPDPLLGTTPWAQNQLVKYQWASGQVPPSWLAPAIDAGAADSNATRASQAALFARADSAPSKIAYGGAAPCSSYGIACMNRTGVPVSFGIWFRPHGAVLDWGTLRWCQAEAVPKNGCYDARRVALDEFGHVQILGHHGNYADERDYLDAVVQFAGRSKPKEGWDTHVYGRCDIARLQLEYELIDAGDPVSTCLSLSTALWIAADSTLISFGSSTRITGDLEVASATAARRLSGDPLTGRVVYLQRRVVGATTWTTITTMSAVAGSDGSYSATITPTETADYRLEYVAPSTEGLRGATSAIVRVTIGVTCSGAASLGGKGAIAPTMPCLDV